jgi:ankyrin repeat protein
VTTRPLPTRSLAEHPHLDQLKRQAKELLEAFKSGSSSATAEVRTHYHDADRETFALHDAQLVLARAYGFDSWPKLKAFVDGATVQRLVDLVRQRKIGEVKAVLETRPELARMSLDNLQVLHHAVFAVSSADRHDEDGVEMVRLLMRHGANAREGIYPFREATTAHAIANDRGLHGIVRAIEEAEAAGRKATGQLPNEPSPLHRAAFEMNHDAVARLLNQGANPNDASYHGLTPVDAAAYRWYRPDTARATQVIRQLLESGGRMTAAAAVVLDDRQWLAARHAAGQLSNQIEDARGLVRIAVTHNRPAILDALLDWGFDVNERIRFTDGDEHVASSSGMPLQAAVNLGRYEMAETLLNRGADPNASIYASGDPVWAAYSRGDARMIALLEKHGGVPNAEIIAESGAVDLARKVLDGEAPVRSDEGAASIPAQMLSGAARQGRPAIVRLALDRIDWGPDDLRWFGMIEQTMRHDGDASVTSPSAASSGRPASSVEESPHLACLRLILARCNPNLLGRITDRQQFGLTALHLVVARGNMTARERVAFAEALLDRGVSLTIRDAVLKSTPLGWASRWGQLDLVKLFLDRGADPAEADAEPWATPIAWAEREKHEEIRAELQRREKGSRKVDK